MRIYLILGIIIITLAGFGLHYFGAAREASVRGEILTEAVSEAVGERKADLKADAQVASKNRVALDSAKRKTQTAREFIRDSRNTNAGGNAGPCADSDPEFSRVLNIAIDASNRAVESARSLSE